MCAGRSLLAVVNPVFHYIIQTALVLELDKLIEEQVRFRPGQHPVQQYRYGDKRHPDQYPIFGPPVWFATGFGIPANIAETR